VTGTGLAVEKITVRFGGLVAVDGVSLEAPTGRITGLIGPNGAGKTTTFNACSGLVAGASGRVFIDGKDVSGTSPMHRARLGLGRTFQRPELFGRMTVRENVSLGREAAIVARRGLFGQIRARRGDDAVIREQTERALAICGIEHLADRSAGTLPTGQQRLVEFAMAIAGPGTILMLDEPSSGLDPSETEQFGEILRALVADRGLAVLLVEHDMALVSSTCDYLYVLDFGRPLIDGPVQEVLRSAEVIAAYLGSTSLETTAETTMAIKRPGV